MESKSEISFSGMVRANDGDNTSERVSELELQVSELKKQLIEIKQSVSCSGELYSEKITGSLFAPLSAHPSE